MIKWLRRGAPLVVLSVITTGCSIWSSGRGAAQPTATAAPTETSTAVLAAAPTATRAPQPTLVPTAAPTTRPTATPAATATPTATATATALPATPTPRAFANTDQQTYTDAEGTWTLTYPAATLRPEALPNPNANTIVFISQDRSTFVAVASFVINPSVIGEDGAGLRTLTTDILGEIYSVQVTTEPLQAAQVAQPWTGGIRFTSAKQTAGEGLYQTQVFGLETLRYYAIFTGYRASEAATARPFVNAVRASFAVVAPQATGAQVTYRSGDQRYAIDLASGDVTEQEPTGDGIVAPDGRRFYIKRSEQGGDGTPQPFEIIEVPANGYETSVLLNADVFYGQFPEFNEAPHALTLSSDGTRLFFDPCRGTTTYSACTGFSIDLATRAVEALNLDCGWGAVIAPDGKRALSTVKAYRDEGGAYFPTALQRTGEQEIELRPGSRGDVVWLDDGGIIFSTDNDWSGDPDDAELVELTADGEVRVLVDRVLIDSLAVAPDGSTIAYLTANERDLWLVARDGSRPRKIAPLPDDATALEWPAP